MKYTYRGVNNPRNPRSTGRAAWPQRGKNSHQRRQLQVGFMACAARTRGGMLL